MNGVPESLSPSPRVASQDLHPERVAMFVIHPIDLIFHALFSVVKWFLDPVTRNKVRPMLFQSGLHELIDKQHLPVTLVMHAGLTVGVFCLWHSIVIAPVWCYCMCCMHRVVTTTMSSTRTTFPTPIRAKWCSEHSLSAVTSSMLSQRTRRGSRSRRRMLLPSSYNQNPE